jgi:hypothetical protein
MVYKMTCFDPAGRPSASRCLRTYFPDIKLATLIKLGTVGAQLDKRTEVSIERVASPLLRSGIGFSSQMVKAITGLAKTIYRRIGGMQVPGVYESQPLLKIEACIWIALKLLTGNGTDKMHSPLPALLELEVQICQFLEYRLHVVVSDSLLS